MISQDLLLLKTRKNIKGFFKDSFKRKFPDCIYIDVLPSLNIIFQDNIGEFKRDDSFGINNLT